MDVQWQNTQVFNPHHYDLHHNPLFQQQHQSQQKNGFFHNNNLASSSNMRKRKADTPENERLSKRLSLLNLGR